MYRFSRDEEKLICKFEHQTLEISRCGKDAVRVRASMRAEFADIPCALIQQKSSPPHIEIHKDYAKLVSGALTVMVNFYGRVQFYKKDDQEPFLEEVDWNPNHLTLYPLSREFKSLDNFLYRISARFVSVPKEHFYGLGQHRHGLLDQKGAVIDLIQRNCEVSIPFLISSRKYGFLWNNPGLGRVELATNDTCWVSDGSRQMDYVVIAGNNFDDIMESYADLTGHAPMFPDWAAGFWQSKLRYKSQEELLAVAREYKKRGLPLSVMVVDFFHWTQQGDWKWDPVLWPDPEGMIKELEQMGVKVMVSIWPSVNPKSENVEEMKSGGFLVKSHHGVDVARSMIDTYEKGSVYAYFYDATNPEAREFIWKKIKENYYDKGVRVFWLDACEPGLNPVEPGNLQFYAGPGIEVANIYPLLHEKGFYDAMKNQGEKEILNLCRSGWAGSQRYAAAIWSGDIDSTWKSLQAQIKAGLNIMLSGIPWWATDIGGFLMGNIENPDYQELIVRWFQYGLFCPLFRLHGFRQPAVQEEDGLPNGAPNEVWSFGEKAYAIIRETLFIRERLRPYILEQMKAASEKGLPPMRPLFFDYPDDSECYEIEDEFLFGGEILVAPVVYPNARKRRVYLPKGSEWVNAWNGNKTRSGVWFEEEAPLERIPVFLKKGSGLKLKGD